MSELEWKNPVTRVSMTMHVHNVLLHAANAALLFVLMLLAVRRAGGEGTDPLWLLALALLWSLHPLRVEVVSWVTERKELLSVFFLLVSLICHLREREFASLACGALALMAKPVAVTLPVVILAWDWVICGKARWDRVWPFALMSAGTCALTLGAQTVAMQCGTEGGPAQRLAAMFGSPLVYIRQTFAPYGLSPDYATSASIPWGLIAAGAVFMAGVAGIGVWWLFGRRRRWLDLAAFAVAWSYVGLVPMLGFVKVGWQEHSDRYTYWVGCGICVSLALALSAYGHRLWRALTDWISRVDGRPFDVAGGRRRLMVASYGLAAVLAVASVSQAEVWRTPMAFLRDTIPRCWDLDLVESATLMLTHNEKDGVREAEEWLRKCAVSRPCARSSLMLARFLVERGSYAEPEMLIAELLAAEPDNREARELLAKIAEAKGGKAGGR